MGSLVCPCRCYSTAVRRLQWAAFSSQKECVWQLNQSVCRKWRSRLNRIGHPDWMKSSVELNCAPNQNTKFSLPLQTHSWEDKGVHTFPKGICPKENVIARLEFELAYYDSVVHRFNHYTSRTPPPYVEGDRHRVQ